MTFEGFETCPFCHQTDTIHDIENTNLNYPYCSDCQKDIEGNEIVTCDQCDTLMYRPRDDWFACSNCRDTFNDKVNRG